MRPEDVDGFYGRFSQSNTLLCEEFLDSQVDILESATRYESPPLWVNYENVEARESPIGVNQIVLD
ncbi:MAG: hypothetical protein U5K56_00235 [Halioglobus sp.]|nr:hypothetical protein [Halioglobus sp.]